jgi:hypothetical protein
LIVLSLSASSVIAGSAAVTITISGLTMGAATAEPRVFRYRHRAMQVPRQRS